MAIWNFWKEEKVLCVRVGCTDGTSLEDAVRVRVIDINNDSEELKENKIKFPFKTDKEINVYIVTDRRNISFNIYKGYVWNGADIPQPLWSTVGGSKDNSYLIASMVHDYMLQYKDETGFNTPDSPRLTSIIFREILKETGVNSAKANIMAGAVHCFQFFFNKKGWYHGS